MKIVPSDFANSLLVLLLAAGLSATKAWAQSVPGASPYLGEVRRDASGKLITITPPPAQNAAHSPAASGNVIKVGPGQNIRLISTAANLAKDGDTIEIDAGDYTGDVAVWKQSNLTIRGVGGRVRLVAAGASAEKKAIWVVRGNRITVENIEFTGARVPDRNGAGIRFEKGHLIVRNCRFIDNENGILTGGGNLDLEIENSEFGHNGAGDGYSHNLYVGAIRMLRVTGSYFHHAKAGHLLKSRAAENHILYNRLTDETDGRASYELEFPNGGIAYVIGNLIEQSKTTENPNVISFGAEGYKHPANELYLINNTLVDKRVDSGFFLAVRHLFRVAASLDSMVVGEPQILGQIKEAYRGAAQAKSAGVILNRLMHRAFFVAKRVRTETGIGDRAVSISYAAVELARKIFGSLEGKRVLLVGAGEMAELAVEHLIRNQVAETLVANRTFENGLELARRFNGQAIRFEEIAEHLRVVDIIMSSTGAPGLVIARETVKPVIRARRNRPIFFIDIAVPRDIDPEINRLENAYVYDIDDLKGIIEENIEDRQKEAVKGERIIDEAVIRFREWHEALDVVPTIVALRAKLEVMADSEIKRTVQAQGMSAEAAQALQRMMGSFINKMLHDPTMHLKRDGMLGDKSLSIDTVRKLFKLDE